MARRGKRTQRKRGGDGPVEVEGEGTYTKPMDKFLEEDRAARMKEVAIKGKYASSKRPQVAQTLSKSLFGKPAGGRKRKTMRRHKGGRKH